MCTVFAPVTRNALHIIEIAEAVESVVPLMASDAVEKWVLVLTSEKTSSSLLIWSAESLNRSSGTEPSERSHRTGPYICALTVVVHVQRAWGRG